MLLFLGFAAAAAVAFCACKPGRAEPCEASYAAWPHQIARARPVAEFFSE